jgi:DNA-binding transcriptional ArsR family regulator
MGTTKKHVHTPEQIEIEMARIFKALSHPARIAIVDHLLKNDSMNSKDLCSKIDLAQSTISEHLKILYEAGIIGCIDIGNSSYFQILNKALDKMSAYIEKVYPDFSFNERLKVFPFAKAQPSIFYQNFNNNS